MKTPKDMSFRRVYDLLIVGGGPCGMTAALYAARAGLDVLLLEKLSAGGQMALTGTIENYPGFPDGIDGFTLGERMRAGAERFGVGFCLAEVTGGRLESETKILETSEEQFFGRTILIATGASPRKLSLPGEEALTGRGVHYCAACDGAQYRGGCVAVVGGGNTAVQDALLLARICKEVHLIHRRDTLRADAVYLSALKGTGNLSFWWSSTVSDLSSLPATVSPRGITLRGVKSGKETFLPCDGLFVCIGHQPSSGFFRGQLETDESGYILTDGETRTNVPGVFAAGDVRGVREGHFPLLRQVVTAAADGALAAHTAAQYLAKSGAEKERLFP